MTDGAARTPKVLHTIAQGKRSATLGYQHPLVNFNPEGVAQNAAVCGTLSGFMCAIAIPYPGCAAVAATLGCDV